MSEIINVDLRVTDLELHNDYQAISKVIVWYDDENAFAAGDDSGRTLEIDCPWATQAMANDILAQVQGYAYKPFSATDASLDPSFELGDAVEICSLYSVIANVTLGSNGLSQIEAPGEDEVNHEYPYLSQSQRELSRTVKLGQQYYGTRITRKEGLVIEKTDGETVSAKAILNADEFSFYAGSSRVLYFDPASQTYKFTGELNVNDKFIVDKDGNITSHGTAQFDGDVTLSGNLAIPNGFITFDNFTTDLQNGLNSTASNAINALNSANLATQQAQSALSGLALIANGQYQGGTFIDQKNIYAPNLYGDTITLLDGQSRQVGVMSLQYAATYAMDITSALSLRLQAAPRYNVYIGNSTSAWVQLLGERLTLSGNPIVISDHNFGSTLPSYGTYGQIFFKLV